MVRELTSELVEALEMHLRPYQNRVLNVLEGYVDFDKLNLSIVNDKGFNYDGSDRGVLFIDALRNHFHKQEIDYETSLWIINSWGGIGSFKDSDTNKARLGKLSKYLERRVFTKGGFGVVSSLSKIASFLNHEEYFVYDSRVIFTLNWLILKSKLVSPVFFPMPESRNTKLTFFDLNTLINLYYVERVTDKNWKSILYLEPTIAYFIYCDLIKEINRRLFPNEKPYYLEMLLFTIAESEIFNEIKSSVSIAIR